MTIATASCSDCRKKSDDDGQNGFTVAPIDYQNHRQGYIYAVLGSEKINHITDVLQRSRKL